MYCVVVVAEAFSVYRDANGKVLVYCRTFVRQDLHAGERRLGKGGQHRHHGIMRHGRHSAAESEPCLRLMPRVSNLNHLLPTFNMDSSVNRTTASQGSDSSAPSAHAIFEYERD